MHSLAPDVFEHAELDTPDGQRYAYSIDGGADRPDPRSLWQPEGILKPSAVLRPERFVWSDQAWRGVPRADLAIYEIHVGTFTAEGTFEAAMPRLPALRDLGVTAIELMPVAQFSGRRNWGYDGVQLFAPQNSYGGPEGLQRLVDACHGHGLAVIMDVVYNHIGPEGNVLHEFGPYFSTRQRTPWGPAFNYDGDSCDRVRTFILDNVRLWLETYHCDGLRLDAIHAIHDDSPRHILQEIQEVAAEIGERRKRHIHVIAESSLNDVRILEPADRGGYGLDAQWSDDFHFVVHAFLAGERQGHYVDFGSASDVAKALAKTFVLDGGHSQYRGRPHGRPTGDMPGDHFIISLQTHDHVGNRAHGERLGVLLTPAAQRLAASLLLLAPNIPLLFMGEEYGESNPFLFFCSFTSERLVNAVRQGRSEMFARLGWSGETPDPQSEATFDACRLQWDWTGSHAAGLRRLYQDLLRLRRELPALKDFSKSEVRTSGEADALVLVLIRGGPALHPHRACHCCFNLAAQPQAMPPVLSSLELLFSSEDAVYDGLRSHSADDLLPYECRIIGPPNYCRK